MLFLVFDYFAVERDVLDFGGGFELLVGWVDGCGGDWGWDVTGQLLESALGDLSHSTRESRPSYILGRAKKLWLAMVSQIGNIGGPTDLRNLGTGKLSRGELLL